MKLNSIIASVLTAACSFCVLTSLAATATPEPRTEDAYRQLTGDEEYDLKKGVLTVNDGVVIDLNGYKLTYKNVGGFAGTGTFTDTSMDNPGELHLSPSSAQKFSLNLSENLRLVKEGSSSLTMDGSFTYEGGTQIDGGSLICGTSTQIVSNFSPFGKRPSVIDVNANGTFDGNGKFTWGDGYTIRLNGGTITSSGQRNSTTQVFNPQIVLTEDSNFSIKSDKIYSMASEVDLGGKTLSIALADVLHYMPSSIKDGTLNVTGTGTFKIDKTLDMSTVNLMVAAPMDLQDKILDVNDYYPFITPSGSGKVIVHGSLKPVAGIEPVCTLANGSTLDLSGLDAPLVIDPACFADSASVTINIGEGTDLNSYLVTWKEGSKVEEGRELPVADINGPKADAVAVFDTTGIKVVTTEVVVDHAVWTGAVDSDFSKADNWQCFTKLGTIIEDAEMTETTPVIFTGELKNFAFPANASIPYNTITFEDLKLASNADFSGVNFESLPQNWTVPENWSIDVDTYELKLAGSTPCPIALTSTATENAGAVRWVVPEGETMTSGWLNLTGTAKFIKDGPGSYSAVDETLPFSGGFVIEQGLVSYEGTAKSLGAVAPFGAKKEITINPDGVLDPKGSANWSTHTIVLNGGTISNTVVEYGIGDKSNSVSDNAGQSSAKRLFNPVIQLQASSTLATSENFNFWGVITPSDGAVLTLAIAAGKQLIWNPSAVGNTTVKVVDGGALRVLAKFPVNAPEMTLVMENGGLHLGSYGSNYGDLTVGGYTAQSTCANTANATLWVGKVFTPKTDGFFPNVRFSDEIKIDLSARTTEWTLPDLSVKPFAGCTKVTIDLGERQVTGGEKLVSWSAKMYPETVDFTRSGTYATKSLIVTEEGITYSIPDTIAIWTGEAGDGNLANSRNWYDESLPTEKAEMQFTGAFANVHLTGGQSLAYKGVAFHDVTLSEDVDFSWLDLDKVTEDSVIDVMSHKLALPKLTETTCAATITDSVGGGIVEMNVEDGIAFSNKTINVTGQVKIEKTGAGTFVGVRDLTNEGGFEVKEGKITPASEKLSLANATPFGKGAITLDKDAILDPLGGYDWSEQTINLKGGLITNTVWQAGLTVNKYGNVIATSTSTCVFNPTIYLLEDSTIAIGEDFNFWGELNANGHELKVSVALGKYFTWYPQKAENLKLNVVYGGWFRTSKYPLTTETQPGLDFTCNAALCMLGTVTANYGGGMDVLNYTSLYAEKDNDGTAIMNVYGTFKAAGNYFHGCRMMNGSTIVTPATGVLNIQSSSSSDGNRILSFADNATVTIDADGREFADDEQVVAWTTEPTNIDGLKFELDAASKAAGYMLERKENGLFVKIGTVGLMTLTEIKAELPRGLDGQPIDFTKKTAAEIKEILDTKADNGLSVNENIILGIQQEENGQFTKKPYLKADASAGVEGGKIKFAFGGITPKTDKADIKFEIFTCGADGAWTAKPEVSGEYGEKDPIAELPDPSEGESAVKYFKVHFNISEKAK